MTVDIAVHHQDIDDLQRTALKNLGRLAVQEDLQTVLQQPEARRYRNAERRRVFRIVEIILVGKRTETEIAACDCHTLCIHVEFFRHRFFETCQLAAAARKKYRRRCAVVELRHTLDDLTCKMPDRLCQQLFDLRPAHRFLQTEDIGKG